MLRKEQGRLYRNEQAARHVVRWVRGQRKNGHAKATPAPEPTATLPTPVETGYKVNDIAPGLRYLLLSDVHLPYHDLCALTAAIDHGVKAGCNGVILLGDILDCYQLSRFERDPRARRFSDELKAAGQLIDYIGQRLKPRAFYWKLGNHEHRYYRYLVDHAPELLGVPAFEWSNILELDRRGVTLVPVNQILRCGHLHLLHGNEWHGGASSPVNPARGAFMQLMSCAVVAHRHRSSMHPEPTLAGELITVWSLGCLCGLHPDYAIVNKWNHGCGVLDATGDWRVQNVRILNGQVME